MIKQSSLLRFVTQNGKNNSNNSANHAKHSTSRNNWIHPADVLQRGHVAYLVKFMGHTEVDQPKGIEVVKEGIRKMKFNQHLKRAEGSKIPKVELTISVDGVAVQDPKSKKILHQYPLHRISYCADDKADKKFFSFIAKESDSENHSCFVFVSDKLSEEITLTIGQAFDLAYRRFLETSGRDLEMRKSVMILQKKVKELEHENQHLKIQLSKYEHVSGQNNLLDKSNPSTNENANETKLITNGDTTCNHHKVSSHTSNNTSNSSSNMKLPSIQPPPSALPRTLNRSFSANKTVNLLDIDISATQPTVGRRLENLSINDIGLGEDDDDFNPRAFDSTNSSSATIQANNNHTNSNNNGNGHVKNGTSSSPSNKDLFGCEPFDSSSDASTDPFGMGEFGEGSAQELENAIGAIDKKLAEMRDGFSRGLSFGNDEFSIESMDPLNQRN